MYILPPLLNTTMQRIKHELFVSAFSKIHTTAYGLEPLHGSSIGNLLSLEDLSPKAKRHKRVHKPRPARAMLKPPKTPLSKAPKRVNKLFTTGSKAASSMLKLVINGPKSARVAAKMSVSMPDMPVIQENLPSPKAAMMLFNAPPISSRSIINAAARPVGSGGDDCLSARAVDDFLSSFPAGDPGIFLMSEVVLTTSLLMEAIAVLKVLAELALFSAVSLLLRPAAVESGG